MKYIFGLFVALLSLTPMQAQSSIDTLTLSLDDVIKLSQTDALDVEIAKTRIRNNFWRYQSFLADYKPQITLDATLPNLNRSINAITLPDGSDQFISRSLMQNNVGLQLQQDIAATGGTVFASTNLSRIDLFGDKGTPNQVSYLSTPISVGFIQPLFAYNELKWEKLIEPIRFDEAKRSYSEDMEQVAYGAASLFFDVLIAQLNLVAAQRDKLNADTLLGITKGRFEVGRIAETELLQIELNSMNANADVSSNSLNLQTSIEQLRNFLGIKNAIFFKLIPPNELPTMIVDAAKALEYAVKNRSETIGFQRRIMEAEQNVAQAKGTVGPNVDLFLSFGLSQTGTTLSEAYQSPLDQEVVQLGFQMPIADWGKARSRMEIARSNEQLVRLQVEQDRINFEREILIKVQQFDLVREQVNIALRAYNIAQKRLSITRDRYRIGKILVTDLNIAISEEAAARRSYINALREFWLAYYDLRRLTLYDFRANESLTREPDQR